MAESERNRDRDVADVKPRLTDDSAVSGVDLSPAEARGSLPYDDKVPQPSIETPGRTSSTAGDEASVQADRGE